MLLDKIQNCAEKTFHINALKPYQLLVTHRIIEQFDTDVAENQIVVLPTGSGKSLCFMIPAVLSKKLTIIIYPLLALMNDQSTKLNKLGIKNVTLRGGQSVEERASVFRHLHTDTRIVITNPETLNQEGIVSRLCQFEIEMLVVDEAHVISQWGSDFRPDYIKLRETITLLNPHQIVSFTATASDKTVNDICSVLYKERPVIVRADTDRDNISYSALPVLSKTQGVIDLLRYCKRPCIVFCGTRGTAYRLCMELKRVFPSYPMLYYHAGLSKEERVEIEAWFKATSDGVLFTTCAYGMGVDIPGIRTIIHHDLPENALEYLQESGRAGRDRKPARAWVLVPYGKQPDGKLENVFSGNLCRRRALLALIGEDKEECSGCDVCTKSVIKYPHGYPEIRSMLRRYPFRFSVNTAAGILAGDVFYRKYRSNPYFGLIDNIDILELRESVKNSGFDILLAKGHKKRTR